MKFTQYLSKMPRSRLTLASVALVLIIGFLDYASWPDVAFMLFYLVPVCMVARFVGRHEAVSVSILASGAWLVVELSQNTSYLHPLVPYWNGLVRLAIFLISSLLISEIVARKRIELRLRETQRELESQIRERTAELERNKLLEKQILEISEREQCRVGQDIHDGLCQHLVSAAFAAAVLRDRLQEKELPEANDANRIADMLNDGLTEARKLARSLYPVRLEMDGLASALEEFAGHMQESTKRPCRFTCRGSLTVSDLAAGANLYRIAQEAVFNAFKHARASDVSITLASSDGQLTLTVADDGVGIPSVAKNSQGMGLHIMHYRARMIGASLDIRPGATRGTTVICSLKNANGLHQQHARL